MTPLLAAFVLLDISSFWIQAWRIRQQVVITYPAFFIGLAVALAYYISAALVFPRQLSEWTDLDEHYAAHKRQVLAGVLFANAVVTALAVTFRPEVWASVFGPEFILFFGLVGALLFTRGKRINAALLSALITYYIAGAATGWFDRGVSPANM